MVKARANLDWDEQIRLSIDPEKAKKYRIAKNKPNTETCSDSQSTTIDIEKPQGRYPKSTEFAQSSRFSKG